jgi:very-short-patch-repair endonuclease
MSRRRHNNNNNNLHPQVSRGEIELFTALSHANLTYGMVTQQTVVLKSTVPDFMWHLKKKAVYLDGVQVHNKAHVERRDEEINDLMERRGWTILRIRYEPPLTPEETAKIVEQIREFIGDSDT